MYIGVSGFESLTDCQPSLSRARQAGYKYQGLHAPLPFRSARNADRLFAVAGYWALGLFSGNHFDGSVEASMTAAFVFGPLGAIAGVVTGAILGKQKRAAADVPN